MQSEAVLWKCDVGCWWKMITWISEEVQNCCCTKSLNEQSRQTQDGSNYWPYWRGTSGKRVWMQVASWSMNSPISGTLVVFLMQVYLCSFPVVFITSSRKRQIMLVKPRVLEEHVKDIPSLPLGEEYLPQVVDHIDYWRRESLFSQLESSIGTCRGCQ